MRTAELLSRYFLEHDLAPTSRATMRLSLARFERWLGRPGEGEDLTDDSVNRYLTDLREERLAKTTIHTYRRTLLTLWRWASEMGLVSTFPRHVKRIKATPPMPEAFRLDQLQSLLAQAAAVVGFFRRSAIARAAFWRAWILVAYSTGLRIGDLLNLRIDDFAPDGSGIVRQSKTGNAVLVRLSTEAAAAVAAIASSNRPFIFRGVLCRRGIQEQFLLLQRTAGLRGGTRKLRKSGASHLERIHPGAAMLFLGHKTPGLAYRHYVDPRISQAERPLPPPLFG